MISAIPSGLMYDTAWDSAIDYLLQPSAAQWRVGVVAESHHRHAAWNSSLLSTAAAKEDPGAYLQLCLHEWLYIEPRNMHRPGRSSWNRSKRPIAAVATHSLLYLARAPQHESNPPVWSCLQLYVSTRGSRCLCCLAMGRWASHLYSVHFAVDSFVVQYPLALSKLAFDEFGPAWSPGLSHRDWFPGMHGDPPLVNWSAEANQAHAGGDIVRVSTRPHLQS